ncbi:Drug:H+ antiporter-1 family protein [Tylopilus felleus]
MASLDRLRHPASDDLEETPLLQGKIPMPWGQLSLAYLVLFSETISNDYLTPFMNKLGITGGDDRKIGYYVGLMESIISVVQIFTTWQWSRLSDFIGRRPVILLGLLSLGVSRVSFGLSRTFGMLVFSRLKGHASRCISSVLDGNVAVMASVLGDLVDNINMAQVFAILPATVSIAGAIGSFYGGELAKPQERWPRVFRGEFWATYPYFLPSFVTGCLILSTFFICAVFLNESLPSKTDKKSQSEIPTVESPEENLPKDDARPVSMLTLMTTYSVMVPVINNGVMSLMDTSFSILLPLFYQSSIGVGGLGLPPHIIGSFWAASSIVESCVQALFAPKLIARFGAKRVLCWAVLWMYPMILLSPIMSAVATAQGRAGPMIWILLITQLMCQVIVDLSFTVLPMSVTKAAPDKQSLGSVNGLNQSLASITRVVGALSASLFAASKQYNIMGGNFVYVVLAMLATIAVVLSRRLSDLEDRDEDEDTEEGISGWHF